MSQPSTPCYYPNGTPADIDSPCNSTAAVSACCGKNSICLDNGLCLYKGMLSRGSCTDAGWGDQCPQYCKNRNRDTGIAITPCRIADDFDWFVCHLWQTGVTCNESSMFQIEGGSSVVLRAEQVSGLGVEGAMVVSSTTLLGEGNGNGADRGYSVATLAGVGAGLGVPLLAALLVALVTSHGQRKSMRKQTARRDVTLENSTAGPKFESTSEMAAEAKMVKEGHSELAHTEVAEMDPVQEARELEGTSAMLLPSVRSPEGYSR